MANNFKATLTVESQEYENKLKRATERLQQMEKECRNLGGTFEFVDKEQYIVFFRQQTILNNF